MITYEILDQKRYDDYFQRKAIKTKFCFDYAIENKVGFSSKHNKYAYASSNQTLSDHSSKLQKLGIIKKTVSITRPSIEQMTAKREREIRTKLRKLLQPLNELQLIAIYRYMEHGSFIIEDKNWYKESQIGLEQVNKK